MGDCKDCAHWERKDIDKFGLAHCGAFPHRDECSADYKRIDEIQKELGATAKYPDYNLKETDPEYERQVNLWKQQEPLRTKAYYQAIQEFVDSGKVNMAYCFDGSSYVAGVVTRADFGCKMFKEIEE